MEEASKVQGASDLVKLTVTAGHLHVLEAWWRLHLQEPVQDVLLVRLLVGRPILLGLER